MAGLPMLNKKTTGALAQSTKGFALIHFLPSGMRSAPTQKSTRRPRQVLIPDQFPNRLEVIHKSASGWFYKSSLTSPPYTKT
jgi:hypothetical protein